MRRNYQLRRPRPFFRKGRERKHYILRYWGLAGRIALYRATAQHRWAIEREAYKLEAVEVPESPMALKFSRPAYWYSDHRPRRVESHTSECDGNRPDRR